MGVSLPKTAKEFQDFIEAKVEEIVQRCKAEANLEVKSAEMMERYGAKLPPAFLASLNHMVIVSFETGVRSGVLMCMEDQAKEMVLNDAGE